MSLLTVTNRKYYNHNIILNRNYNIVSELQTGVAIDLQGRNLNEYLGCYWNKIQYKPGKKEYSHLVTNEKCN